MKVRCECCDGTGRRELTPIEQRTLDAVPSHWGDTSEVTADLRGVKHRAVCNRLSRLLDLGLVESRLHPTIGTQKQWRRRP